MQCPNCKKDLVAGYECEPCKAILNPQPVEVAPVETKVAKVKRVAKAAVKRVTKRK